MATLPEYFQQLHAQVEQHPERLALRGADGELTYRQMWLAAGELAQQLKDRGHSRVGLCGDNSMAWVLADLACLLADVVCVPVPVFFSQGQKNHLTQRAALDALLFSDASAPKAARSLGHGVSLQSLPVFPAPARMPEQTAKITFTSGSTGTPKGVCLSASQMTATTLALQERLKHVELEYHLCILPLATLLENIAGVYLPLLMGAAVTVAPLQSLGMTGSSGLSLDRLVAGVRQHRPHSMILVPELAMALVNAAEQGELKRHDFRFVAVGGGRVSASLLARAEAVGLPIYEGYGLSECASVVALNVPDAARVGAVGRPLDHVEVRVDGDRRILVRGNTHLGYLGDELATEQDECWLDTGDLGALDSDGFLSVNGRAKNLLITSFGRNISPEWLESELIQAVGARQAVVLGDGEAQPFALLVMAGGCPVETVQTALHRLNERLPDYARLSSVYLRHQPLTAGQGYITANGRPVRHRLQADLPVLMADALYLSLKNPGAAPSMAPSPTQRQEYSS
ncbi:MAG: AMP-binding protein [Alteromonadaceae bacterium]|nr:AMP-binding protein [Alteromonadaceae bacterium]